MRAGGIPFSKKINQLDDCLFISSWCQGSGILVAYILYRTIYGGSWRGAVSATLVAVTILVILVALVAIHRIWSV